MSANKEHDNIASWSPGTSPLSPSTRFASEEPTLSDYGVNPAKAQPPYSGLGFFKRFRFCADQLSISKALTTDREWSVGRAAILIVKGTVDLEPIQEALQEEGIYPILCRVKGEDKPKALASIWINEIHDSVCGAYHEYVVSFDVHKSRKDVTAFTSGLSPASFACF